MASNELYDPPSAPADWNAVDALDQLKLRLETALILELHTIPLYLFPKYCIKDQDDSAVSDLHKIVLQEMLHLALAGNILRAIGGEPKLYGETYMPKYPTEIFYDKVKLNLAEATKRNIGSFLEQPAPAVRGLLNRYHSIGEFYKDVENGLDALSKSKGDSLFPSDAHAYQFTGFGFKGDLVVIQDISTAQKALKLIVEQGEGGPDGGEQSHYTKFKAMLDKAPIESHPVINNPTTSSYEGEKIYEVMRALDAVYSYLLLTIEKSWSCNDSRRKGLIGNIRSLMSMITRLSEFLVTQPLEANDSHAAPPFNFFGFNTSESTLKQLGEQITKAGKVYTDLQDMKGDVENLSWDVDDLVHV